VWALQQPLDRRLFGVEYDDTALLGKAVTRGEGWVAAGIVLHLLNGALFGAVYANAAPRAPLPPPLRGPAAGLLEHLGTWPLASLADRYHPRREELPRLFGDHRAFAQATWRHLLFGTVLGEIERRVNREPAGEATVPAAAFSSNGHGSLEHAISVES
jgi:hypothetical protein